MPPSTDLLQGTLGSADFADAGPGPMHGWGVAQRIQQISKEVLQIGQGSLYPALHRLEYKGWIRADWGSSENNRKAKYLLADGDGPEAAGRSELETWERLSEAIGLVLGRIPEACVMMKEWLTRLRFLVSRRKPDDLDDELRFHRGAGDRGATLLRGWPLTKRVGERLSSLAGWSGRASRPLSSGRVGGWERWRRMCAMRCG